MQTFHGIASEQHAVVFARTLIGLVLLTAGVAKLIKGREFIKVVRDYDLLPQGMAAFVGQLLPSVELLLGVCLLLGILVEWSALTAALILLLFACAVAINLARGRRDIACGCFGQRDHKLSWAIVIRNAILATVAGIVWLSSFFLHDVDSVPTGEAVAMMLIAVALLACWCLGGIISRIWRMNPGR